MKGFSALPIVVLIGSALFLGSVLLPSENLGIAVVQRTDTIGTLRTTVNELIGAVQNTTSTLGSLASQATTTGNLLVGSSTSGWVALSQSNSGPGDILTVSSTAPQLVAWASTTASGITTLNGQTGATQTFASSTTGADFKVVSDSNSHTFHLPDAGASARGLISIANQYFAGLKQFVNGAVFQSRLGTPTSTTLALSNAGDIGIDTASTSFGFHNGTNDIRILGEDIKSFTVLQSTSTDPRIPLFRLNTHNATITKISCSNGNTGDTFPIQLTFGTDSAAAGTNVFSSAQTCNTTTASSVTAFANASFSVGDQIWVATSSIGSTAVSSSAAHVDIYLRYNP